MAHGIEVSSENSVQNTSSEKTPPKKTVVTGSRRIFPAVFKIMVLDSYRNDKDCIGNQRATARKYGIHRRQIQKWLQCEQDLRNSCANSNSSSNISNTSNSSISSISANGTNGNKTGINLTVRLQEIPRLAPIGDEQKYWNYDSYRSDSIVYGRYLDSERVSPDSTSNIGSEREDCGGSNSGDCKKSGSESKFGSIKNLIGSDGSDSNGVGSEFCRISPQPVDNLIRTSISNGIGSISNGIGSSGEFPRISTKSNESLIGSSLDNRIGSISNGIGSINNGIGSNGEFPRISAKSNESLIGSSIDNRIGSISNGIGSINNGIGSNGEFQRISPRSTESLIGSTSITNGIGSITNGIRSNLSTLDFPRISPKLTESLVGSTSNTSNTSIINGIRPTEFTQISSENLLITSDNRLINNGIPPEYHHFPSPPLDYYTRPDLVPMNSNSIRKIMGLDSNLTLEGSEDSTSESGSHSPSDSDDPLDCSLEIPRQEEFVTRRRSFPLAFKLQVLDNYHENDGNQRATARRFRINRRQVQKWLAQENKLRQEVSLRQGESRQRLAAVEPSPGPVDLRTCVNQEKPLCLVKPKSNLPKPKKDYISFKPYLDNPVVKPDEQRNENNCYCFTLPRWGYYHDGPSAFVNYPVHY